MVLTTLINTLRCGRNSINNKNNNMATLDLLVPFILKWEGGYVNDPTDRGGATNKGVTLATYTAYRKAKGGRMPTANDLKRLTHGEWVEIFKTMFWDRWQADKIKSQAVAVLLVDWLWHSGAHGIRIPQRVLGVEADGKVGSQTIEAINAADPKELFTRLYEARKQFFESVARNSVSAYEKRLGRRATETEKNKHTQVRFLKGWINRLEDLKRFTSEL